MLDTWAKTVIFFVYVGFFVTLGLLVTASPRTADGEYDYNPVTVVLLAEVAKLAASLGIYTSEGHTPQEYFDAVMATSHMFRLYLIPAGLYAIYNMLIFYNLRAFDPGSYFMFLQLRTVGTGIAFQVLFNKKLSGMQWLSLALVTFGCIVQGGRGKETDSPNQWSEFSLMLMLLQVVCTCAAGVFNEFLLKGNSGSAHPMVQNCYMYADSIAVNVVVLGFRGELSGAFTPESLAKVTGSTVLLGVICVQAAAGITASLFLKHLNSIVKTFATALEITGSAIAAWVVLGIPITARTGVAIVIILAAIFLYAKNPVEQPRDHTDAAVKPGEDVALERGAGGAAGTLGGTAAADKAKLPLG